MQHSLLRDFVDQNGAVQLVDPSVQRFAGFIAAPCEIEMRDVSHTE